MPLPPTRTRLLCRNGECRCAEHRDLADYVACCPRHGAPLIGSQLEPGYGYCRECAAAGDLAHHPPTAWQWIHRDTFNGDEVPPWNGWRPLDVGAPVGLTLTLPSPAQAAEALRALSVADVDTAEVIVRFDPVAHADALRDSRGHRPRRPYVDDDAARADPADACRRSAEIDRAEAATLPTGPHQPGYSATTEERRNHLLASAEAWEAQADQLEAAADTGKANA